MVILPVEICLHLAHAFIYMRLPWKNSNFIRCQLQNTALSILRSHLLFYNRDLLARECRLLFNLEQHLRRECLALPFAFSLHAERTFLSASSDIDILAIRNGLVSEVFRWSRFKAETREKLTYF